MVSLMKVTSKGQVTIPIDIRDRFGIMPNSEVEFVEEDERVVLRKKNSTGSRGQKYVAAIRGKGSVKMTTDEIMALTRGEPRK